MSSDIVPLATSASDIYSGQFDEHQARFQQLSEEFTRIYGTPPAYIARAPGRVNIIGEHIDYCGMPVFPMAIELDTLIAVAPTDTQEVRVANTKHEKYSAFSFTYCEKDIVYIDSSVHSWANYFKCGYKGAIEFLKINNPKGMNCLLDGHVPTGAGLSSSSAMVSCVVLATFNINNAQLSKEDIVNISVASERYVGVNGGGMDQTCSVMAQRSSALFIEFSPKLNTTSVRFPKTDPEISFVIANTLVVSDKQVTAPVCYNLRVVETRIASLMLAKYLGLDKNPQISNVDPLTMKIIMDVYFANKDNHPSDSVDSWIFRLSEMLSHTQKLFSNKPDGYTWEECAEYLNITVEDIKNKVHVNKFPVRAEKLQLFKRSVHVYSETLRVVKFRQICETADASINPLIELGKLMNESQDSCNKLFDCSCEELNELCQISINAGATGSRLTGAGWGGCTISMVPSNKVDSFIQTVKSQYYAKHHPNLTEEQLEDVIFSTKPGNSLDSSYTVSIDYGIWHYLIPARISLAWKYTYVLKIFC
ncbi:hypothetical protein BB561_000547 [Smittium simulii]|uniref:Galactokinase n=1 Tax=Smittium simulii TaxID=133385 RepID=A0A2T9YYM1_9FUNG|nr:hypothetical protein BB561_000547 [Smittium simulii]